MISGKRILSGILAAVMVLSAGQLPGDVSYAEELPASQNSITEDVFVEDMGTSEEGAPTDEENGEASEEEVFPDGEDEGTFAEETPADGEDEGAFAEETPADGENEGASKEEVLPDGEDEGTFAEQEPSDGGDGESSEEKAENEKEEPDAPLFADDATVSENDLQISGNDLMSAGEPEVWTDAEIEGAYQFGGAPSADEGTAPYAAAAYTDEQIMDYLYEKMKARVTRIDVSQYNIPYETEKPTKIQRLVSGALNEHPDLYFVGNGFAYSVSGTKIGSLTMTYDTTLSDSAWQQGVEAALKTVEPGMSDLQKAIVLHDYLAVNCEYDYENLNAGTLPGESYNTYGVFAKRTAVCQGYALAYKYLLNRAGIDCYMVTSDAMNHAWNLIKLGGQYYQVDVTWDDPVWDIVGRVSHSYMFCSDAAFRDASQERHYEWVVTSGSSVVDYQATDTRYDGAFWSNCTSPLVLSGNACYYISKNGSPSGKPALMKTSLSAVTSAGMALQEIDRWTAWPSGAMAWSGAYSGLYRIGDRLFYNDKQNIYSVAMDGMDKKTEFTANTAYSGYIYGSAYIRGAVYYSLHDSPGLKGKEEVLKADIGGGGTVPPPESGVAQNLDNPFCEFKTLDDQRINSAADGKPKLLIFYRNSCGNCRSTIRSIGSAIDRFAGADIYALEVDGGTKEETARIQEEYGCAEMIFSYDTAQENRNSMYAYLWQAGIEDTAAAMPVICYIDANNRLQYITRGLKSAEEVTANLEKFCKFSQAFAIKPPAVTTYKVGQKINLRGGTVTYPSGSGTKTIAIAANMTKGFDSSKPGICKVNVTVSGYTGSFDTLIVEEPKLTASVGQSLREIVFPDNPHGMYVWREDDAQTVGKVGVYSFLAAFMPNEPEKFQGLDVKAQVTAQETFGNDTFVTLKANRFIYNGSEQEPKAAVLSSGVLLKEGRDYELSYENNTDAGEATVTVNGTGCYLGRISRTFRIQPAPVQIRAKDKTIQVGDGIPQGGAYEYEVSGLAGKDELLVQPLFTCAVTDTSETGRYDVVPSGADAGPNYTITYKNGTLTVSHEYVSCTVTFDMRGHGTAVAAQVGLRAGGTANRPKEPSAAGYRFAGWYRDAACTRAWDFDADIVAADMTLYAKWLEESRENSGFAFQEIADMYYTGKACKPAVSVYDGDVPLKSGRDYQIRYYNHTNANKDGVQKQGNGAGSCFNPDLPYVEIIGRGDYTDRIKDGNKDIVKVNFNILRASIGDGSEQPAAGVVLKISEQLAVAKKAQRPFSSVKYAKSMKRDVDFRLRLTVENARDESGRDRPQNEELPGAEIPKGYEGEFLLTVEGIGNYTGSVCRTVYVTDKAHMLKNAKITLGKNLKNITYAGKPVKLAPSEEGSPDTFTVKCGKTVLKPGRDYTVGYRNHDKAGKAELIITGNGAYAGTKSAFFVIKGRPFSAKTVQVDGIENKVYTGRALTQNHVALIYGAKDAPGETLRYGTDYTISYAKNINKGVATMTFKGREEAGFSGSFKKTFKIAAADIADTSQVSLAPAAADIKLPYRKAGAKPVEELVLTNREGFALRNGRDYTLKYKNNRAVADQDAEKPPTVTVQGKGNYAGKLDVTFEITKSGLKYAADSGDIQLTAAGTAYNPNKAQDYVYKPAVKLTEGKTALRADVDYEIQYLNNTQADYEAYLKAFEESAAGENVSPDGKPGLWEIMPKAVVRAKAEGSYEADGEIVVPLPIYKKKFVKKELRIEVEEAVYTGSQLTPAVTVRDYSGKTLAQGKDYTVSYGANVKSGRNKGSVTIAGTAPEYGGSVTVKFDVMKKTIIY